MISFLVRLVEDRRLAVATAGALAIVAGSAAPWAHVAQGPLGTSPELGLEADGKITILLGLLALGLVVAHAFLRHRDLLVGAGSAAAGAAAYGILYALNVREASRSVTARLLEANPDAVNVRFDATTGIGVWTVIGGALVLGVACVALWRGGPKTESAGAASEAPPTRSSDPRKPTGSRRSARSRRAAPSEPRRARS